MALQCGIVGLPNVGKSTLFNCLSNAKAQAANFPFCTIEPNVGILKKGACGTFFETQSFCCISVYLGTVVCGYGKG